MENENPDRRTKGYILMRTIMDYGMGIIIFGIGIFFLVAPKIGFDVGIEDFFRYSFAILCLVYGTWRVYRGFKKNYFR